MAFNGRFVLSIAHFAAQQGGDFKAVLAAAGKSETELLASETTIDASKYNRALEIAIDTSDDKFLGLHAGEQMNLVAAGLIAQLTQTSATVKEALEHCCNFANLGCSSLPMCLHENDTHFEISMAPDLVWRNDSELAFQQTASGIVAFAIKQFQSLTHRKHKPIAVFLPWKKTEVDKEYERVFGCPVYFNKPFLTIALDKVHVEDKVVSADFELQRLLLVHAENLSSSYAKKMGLVALVANSIVKLQNLEFPKLDEVAAHLNMSSRSMQRSLNLEGKSFLTILDEVKNQFAKQFLERENLSISEISHLLGYNDASAFSRSFKKWNGVSPRAFRTHIPHKA